MLTDHSASRLIQFLKNLDKKNIEWELDWGQDYSSIKVFDTRFRLTKFGINELAKYINTYNVMAEKADSAFHSNAMVQDKLKDIKEKWELYTELMGKLFKALQQRAEDHNPSSNVDDVQGVPPPDIVDKGA